MRVGLPQFTLTPALSRREREKSGAHYLAVGSVKSSTIKKQTDGRYKTNDLNQDTAIVGRCVPVPWASRLKSV